MFWDIGDIAIDAEGTRWRVTEVVYGNPFNYDWDDWLILEPAESDSPRGCLVSSSRFLWKEATETVH